MNRHWWRVFCKTVKAVYQQCLTFQVLNFGKIIFVLRGQTPPSGPFEHSQLDFIQLPLSVGYQYELVIG